MKKTENEISDNSAFSAFVPLIEAANGLTLAQVCTLSGVEAYTVQNWIKRGFVAHPENKRYFGRQLARILLIASLKDGMKIDDIGILMAKVNGSADDESDDIITEEKLYDYYHEVRESLGEGRAGDDEIRMTVDEVIKEYSPRRAGAAQVLREALVTMIYASIAGEYKNKSMKYFEKVKI